MAYDVDFDVNKEINRSMEEWIELQEEKMKIAFKACGLTYQRRRDTELVNICEAYKDAARLFYYLGKQHGAHTSREAVGVN